VRGSLRERNRDDFKNARYIAQYLVVPEPQNSIVVIDKPFVANHIERIVGVLTSVYLNNEPTFAANEINYVWTDRFLPNKLVAIEPARPDTPPEGGLNVSGIASQAPRAPGFDFISCSHEETPPHPDHRKAMIRPLPARGERLTLLKIQ
jgi:hypothetical protein